MKHSTPKTGFIFHTLNVVLLWSVLLGGCTFRVNNMIDKPDANPGDFRCEIAVDGGPNVVTTNAGRCTLRAAIEEANATIVEDTIEVPPGVYQLNLPSNLGGGRLEITEDVVIQGSGANVTAVDGIHETRILGIGTSDDSADVKISGLTIQNGRGGSSLPGGGIQIREGSTLELTDSIVRDNETRAPGGGIANSGSLYLFRSTVRDNKIPNDSTVETPPSGGGGGTQHSGAGIMNYSGADLIVENSTITGNFTTRGGGIRNAGGSMEIRNSTISGNTARIRGGGIMNFGDADISFTTITDNQARSAPGNSGSEHHGGGGIYNSGEITMTNSILAENMDHEGFPDYSPDCRTDIPNAPDPIPGQISSQGGNIVGVITSDCNFETNSDLTGTENAPLDPTLNILSNWGGTTRTHQLGSNSLAVDHGDGFGGCPNTDQRGFFRPVDGNDDNNAVCDSGAYESGAMPSVLSISNVSASGQQSQNPNGETFEPERTIDENFGTRWASFGDGEWISYDLGSVRNIATVEIGWFESDSRVWNFDIEVSMNQTDWTVVANLSSNSISPDNAFETFNIFPNVAARYIRIVGHGNSVNDWNSIYEVRILGS